MTQPSWLKPIEAPVDRDASYVSVQSVSKIYKTRNGDVKAVEHADFDIEEGDFVSLVGPSGCGKTTLMSIIGGLEPATRGRIFVAGNEVSVPRPDFGYVFQDATLLPWKNVMDNVLFPIRIQKRPIEQYREEAEKLLRLTGLWDSIDKHPSELSGGMRQRVAICRGLINDPRLLMMDEPFSALDAITRDDMNVALNRLWDDVRKTAVFITHNIREAVFLSDRVLVITSQPAKIIADIRVPFQRPRRIEAQEDPVFNEICSFIRERIHESHEKHTAV